MVPVAEVRGRRGSWLLIIEILGARAAEFHLVVSQLTNRELNERTPLVRCREHQDDDLVEQSQGISFDLDHLDVPEATNET
jgi:hypothetical protein